MRIDVRPRYVAAPWDPETALRIVGMEADVQPERGPLELYLSVFEHREVRWDYLYQSFAIYHCAPGEPEELVERLTYWDSAPDPVTGEELTDEQIAAMAGRDAAIVRRFMPFDYQFVNRRLRGRYEIQHQGARKYQQRLADRNAMRARSKRRDAVRNMAAGWNEVKDWAPVLQDYQRTGRWNPGMRRAMAAGVTFPRATSPTSSTPSSSASSSLITVVSR